MPTNPVPPTTHLKLRLGGPDGDLFTFEGGSVSWGGNRTYVGWMPDGAPGSTLFTPAVAWLLASPVHVELAGLFDNATLYWTQVVQEPDRRLDTRTLTYVTPGGFRAVCIWRPGQVVGVTAKNRVLWLMVRGGRFAERAVPVEVGSPAGPVACFPSRATNEVLVVLEDGTLARVPVPG